ncbi:MAG: LURP-one-related family protein [Sedimentisphaerales bacterium]|nr:LURP-one-related family protein [Sedimentisphaerales bacterium]
MRYVMKQKMFSWGDDFVIKDAEGNERFFVDGRALSIGHKLSFQDMAGHEQAFIRQRLLAWVPTYEVYREGQLYAIIKKKLLTFFRCKFTVDVPGPMDFDVQGNFTDHEYTFTCGGSTVATVSKKWFSWSDTYGVDIADGQDDVILLATTVAIDMICHDKRHEGAGD